MASGRLGVSALVANTDTTVYTVPTGKLASCNVALVNRGTVDAVCSIAFSTTAAPNVSEYVEFNVVVPAGGILERTAILASAGERVVIRANVGTVSARVHGYEESV